MGRYGIGENINPFELSENEMSIENLIQQMINGICNEFFDFSE